MLFGNKKHKQFAELFQPHLSAAYNLARYLSGNAADAEDIVQEVYLKAYRAFAEYRNDNSRAWILTITRNTSYSWLRKYKHESGLSFDEELHSMEQNVFSATATKLVGPEAHVELVSQQLMVRRAIEALPQEFREVIVLRELEELSYEEISQILAIPKGTVMSRLARARCRLQQPLAEMKTANKI